MATGIAIGLLIGLAIMDALLVISCAELEKREEEWEKRNGKIH